MSETTLGFDCHPQTNWKVRCEATNALKTPEIYDMTYSLPEILAIEEESVADKRPRFMFRQCQSITPAYHPLSRQTGFVRMAYCLVGSALLISPEGESTLMAPGFFVVFPATADLDLLLGRSHQVWITAYWEPDSLYVPGSDFADIRRFTIGDLSPELASLTRTVSALQSDARNRPNLVNGWLNLLLDESADSKEPFHLAPIAGEHEDTLSDLIQGIQNAPGDEWSLTSAAKFVGYSPFHLSRIFRSAIGVGLPKYVELCRAELAVNRLLKEAGSIGTVAQECGFGSCQAMRTAIREHTGFLPVELRGRGGE